MANTNTNIIDKILAQGLLALRPSTVMPRLVNGDYASFGAQRGSTIDVPLPRPQTDAAVTAAATPTQASDVTPGLVQISLSEWRETRFYLTDQDMDRIDRDRHFVPMQVSEAAKALANQANAFIHGKYLGVYGYAGTAGTTPFASTVNAATDARKVLNLQYAPLDQRRLVLDPNAEAAALALPAFNAAYSSGSPDVIVDGMIGRKLGFDIYMDQQVKTQTAGTTSALTGGPTVGSTTAAGASALDFNGSSATATLNVGDIFSIAGNTQTYVVTSGGSTFASNASKTSVSFDPPLVAIATSTNLITVRATHVVNLAFQRNAFAFVNRPLADTTMGMNLGSEIRTMQDPVSGITLRLEVSRQYKQVQWQFDLLYGAALVRPELAARLAG